MSDTRYAIDICIQLTGDGRWDENKDFLQLVATTVDALQKQAATDLQSFRDVCGDQTATISIQKKQRNFQPSEQ